MKHRRSVIGVVILCALSGIASAAFAEEVTTSQSPLTAAVPLKAMTTGSGIADIRRGDSIFKIDGELVVGQPLEMMRLINIKAVYQHYAFD